jgi:hypothetical protein
MQSINNEITTEINNEEIIYLKTLKILFDKYVFANIFNNIDSQNLTYQSDLKNKILEFHLAILQENNLNYHIDNNEIIDNLEVNEFCNLLLSDYIKYEINDELKYHYLCSYIKFIFDFDSNMSIVTNPKIDDETYENLSQIANIVIFAIYKEIIDPILGSILIAEIWPLVSYDSRLNKFIGREMEINEIRNLIKETTDPKMILELEDKIVQEKRKLIFVSQMFIVSNTR